MFTTARPASHSRISTGVLAAALITLPLALAACDMTEPAENPIDTTVSATNTASASEINNSRGSTGDWGSTTFSNGYGTMTEESIAPADDSVTEADSVEEIIYIAALDNSGIYYATEAQAIDAGETICMRLHAGEDLNNIMLDYATGTPLNPGVRNEDAGSFAGAGITAFCPEYDADMQTFIDMWS